MLRNSFKTNEQGAVAILVAIMSITLIGMTAFAVDVGMSRARRFDLQVAADAGARAGATLLRAPANGGSVPTKETILAEAISLARANESTATIQAELGRWTGSAFLTGNGVIANAVRVTASKPVATTFARIWRILATNPKAISIATAGAADEVNCVIPFGLEDTVVRTAHYGDVLNVSQPSSGNWGKLDIDGNMSSGSAFYDAMVSSMCNRTVSIGDRISPGTGYAKVKDGFEARRLVNPIVIIPVVSGFPNGNSQPVIVRGFITAELVSQGRGNGSKWTGQIRYLNQFVGNSVNGSGSEPISQNVDLVY